VIGLRGDGFMVAGAAALLGSVGRFCHSSVDWCSAQVRRHGQTRSELASQRDANYIGMSVDLLMSSRQICLAMGRTWFARQPLATRSHRGRSESLSAAVLARKASAAHGCTPGPAHSARTP
jgi:hypothetical protein